mmetsp:Transcript_29278/g.75167  ORF Transcript_29278/g.75167 Transcript_29278/m.75167 type:complete len:274 (+) Transcript_29278:630-1451(+)
MQRPLSDGTMPDSRKPACRAQPSSSALHSTPRASTCITNGSMRNTRHPALAAAAVTLETTSSASALSWLAYTHSPPLRPAARVSGVGSAKQLMRPLQELVVNMCGCALIRSTRSWMGASTDPLRERSPSRSYSSCSALRRRVANSLSAAILPTPCKPRCCCRSPLGTRAQALALALASVCLSMGARLRSVDGVSVYLERAASEAYHLAKPLELLLAVAQQVFYLLRLAHAALRLKVVAHLLLQLASRLRRRLPHYPHKLPILCEHGGAVYEGL